jgi:hypothetical protein
MTLGNKSLMGVLMTFRPMIVVSIIVVKFCILLRWWH